MLTSGKLTIAIVLLFLVFFAAIPFLQYHADPTVESEVVNTRSETTGDGHGMNAWADVKNVDDETGRACVHFNFVERGGELKQQTVCKDGLEPGETAVVHARIHADGKSITRDEIRNMDLRAFAEPERDSDSIWNLQ